MGDLDSTRTTESQRLLEKIRDPSGKQSCVWENESDKAAMVV